MGLLIGLIIGILIGAFGMKMLGSKMEDKISKL